MCIRDSYNFLAATMRALGDSKSALYFLMISAVLNIGGDLFFVEALDWGSEGCALSTVLSEGMCCLLCALYIRWKVPVLQLGRRWFVFDGKLLCKTVSYGWVSAMQQATVQLGKIAVQAIVNTWASAPWPPLPRPPASTTLPTLRSRTSATP